MKIKKNPFWKGKKFLKHLKEEKVWNRGLTKEIDERVKKNGQSRRKQKINGICLHEMP